MRDTSLLQIAEGEHRKRYRVSVLHDPQLGEAGIGYRDAEGHRQLDWSAVRSALAGEVGEPEGVRTVVFDLVVEAVDAPEGCSFVVRRLDAEPGEDAMTVATAIERAIGSAADASIKSLAAEGLPSSRYPDLEEFEAAALETLLSGQ